MKCVWTSTIPGNPSDIQIWRTSVASSFVSRPALSSRRAEIAFHAEEFE
jgi:hypothetical protein